MVTSKILMLVFIFIIIQSCSNKSELQFREINKSSLTTQTPTSQSELASVKIRLGDRYFVKSVLDQIFGENCGNIVVENITNKMDHFGGGCDPYEKSFNSENEIEFSDTACKGANFSSLAIGESSPIREGFRIGACDQLVSNYQCLKNALKKIHGAIDASETILPSNVNSIEQVYTLFYPYKDNPSEKSKKALVALHDKLQSAPPYEQWKNLLLAVCLTPWWQIP